MLAVWIYQNDKQSYIDLMNMECDKPIIRQETEDRLQVDFCEAAMSVWIQADYYYSFD